MSARKGRLKKVYPLPKNKNGDLVSIAKEKADVFNTLFASFFTANLSPCPPELIDCKMGTKGGQSPSHCRR